MQEFEELRIRVRRIGIRRYLVLANGPVNAVTVLRIGDEPTALRAEFTKLIDIELGRAPTGTSNVDSRLRDLGRSVFDLLFNDELSRCLRKARNESTAPGLRLRFDLPAELQDLPLEALRAPSDRAEQTLALNAALSLTRSWPGDPPHRRLPTEAEEPDFIRLLVAIAAPTGAPPIESEKELAELRRDLPEMTIQTTVCQHATRRAIESWLAEHSDRPAAVLLIAHGSYDEDRGEGVVLLEAEDGTSDRVPGHLLSGILVQAQKLRLVVLNLCSGAHSTKFEPFSGLAQALIGRGIPVVAGMNGLVTDRAASMLSPRLLEGICSNKTVDEAMTAVRQHIANLPGHTAIEWATPTLFLHEAYGHGWLFKAREVRDTKDAAHDPLRAGRRALDRYNAPGDVSLADVLSAAEYLRTWRDWEGVLSKVRSRRPKRDQARMIKEAEIELAWPAIEQVCSVLAGEADPDRAAELLHRVQQPLPDPLSRQLYAEINQTRKLAELTDQAQEAETADDWASAVHHYEQVLAERPDGFRDVPKRLAAARQETELADRYAKAENRRKARQWSAALEDYTAILELRQEGYRAASSCASYVRGRIAETEQGWAQAIDSYQGCAGFGDTAARSAYVRGRIAAEAGEWEKANREFQVARDGGMTPDEWFGYSAARMAEAAEQWSVAGEAFAGLTGFLDSEQRSLFAAAQLAAQAGDWAAVAEICERLAALDWDVAALLAEAHGEVYARGAAAEEAHAWQEAVNHYRRLPSHYRDVSARKEYVEARLAEEADDWALAVEHYRACDHTDAATRLDYARGREAEGRGAWDDAYRIYESLPKHLLDAASRARFAAGQSADDRADWSGVIEGFGELPDGFADGEVGRRRRYARARLAAERSDWRSVLALLGDASDMERDGLVGVARREAQGHLAEEEGDWKAAADAYRPAADADPDVGRAYCYASARQAEAAHDWPRALAEYAALPADHRDLANRMPYARARLAEQDGAGWPEIINAYANLPAEFEDVAIRSAYARLRLAIDEQDWEKACGMAKVLGDFRDAETLIGYARGRLAEQCEDWAGAIAAYQECVGHADSTGRRAYATGRDLEDTGEWSAAIAAYDESPELTADGAQRRDRLERLRAALPWADGLTSATLVADPVAQREEAFPYRALDSVGVTPASPTDVVQDAAYTLMERGGMSWHERVAWDQLRTPGKRLLVDARLYQIRDPDALGQALRKLDPGDGSALLDRLCEKLPGDAPLLTLLAGDRTDAITTWRRQLAEAPGDVAAVHRVAVASFWWAQELENTGAWEQAEQVWRTALACWAVLLTGDEYWIGWRQARAACYGHAVTPADTARLRAALGRELIDLLIGHAERHNGAGRPQQAESYRELISCLEAELEAAQILKEAGGLPLAGETTSTLACGPAYLRMVGRATEFGRFVALVDGGRPGDAEGSGETIRRLRWSFSELSTAFSCFEHHRFEPALRALPDFHRRPLVELPSDCAGPNAGDHGEIGGCGHCRDFLERNPAYTYLPSRRARLLQDAVGLAVRAHLFIARGLLATGNRDEAMTGLTEAITVAANATMTVRTREAALRMILGRVDALAGQSTRRIESLDEALTLLKKAMPVVGKLGRATLTMKHADLLIDRGIWYGNRQDGVSPDVRRAVDDLRKAFKLNPGSVRARDNLAQALVDCMAELPGGHTDAGQLAILLEAFTIVHEGLISATANNRLLESLRAVLDGLESLLLARFALGELRKLLQAYRDAELATDPRERARVLAKEADRLRAAGEFTKSVHALVRATRAHPADAQREKLLTALGEEVARWKEG